ncbi:hypothetical protein CK203_053401 [Vitis vinifera]|uniref:Uncharacterized protein n=1 Tax=Vitis vinifera TaxID=29760 RepID=A0A438GZL0_VITVI|nr:hypothetical protein CK203_053401 [Vitis vinifera]
MIGETCVEKALLDLGASVNLLPYSVYKQLGLGELKPTSITLSLADRSVKIPRVREEILPLFNEETQEAVKEEPPKLILKPLPTELKYAYLGEQAEPCCYFFISYHYSEDCLLEILRRCKKA